MDNKKRKNTGKRTKIIAIVVSLAVLIAIVLLVFSPKGEEESVQYAIYQVGTRNIETTVNGSGSVSSAQTTPYSALAGGTGIQVIALSGDAVERGDLLAVLSANADSSRQLSSIADAMTEDHMSLTKLYTYSSGITKVKSPVKGRIKMLSVSEGDDVGIVQQRSVLCVISSDGDMYVEFTPTEGVELAINQKVNVEVDDKKISGTVVKTDSQGTARVLITSDVYDQGTEVTIYDTDANAIGQGELMINAPVAVVATGGYVSSISVDENDRVSEGSTLMQLVQTGLDEGYAGALAVVAPANGILSDLAITDGGVLDSDTLMFNLLSADEYTLSVAVDELDIASVMPGQNATVAVDALSNKTFTGTVQRVSSVGVSSGGVATYDVVISLADANGVLPGMSASADICTAYRENVVTVPVDALISMGGKQYVMKAAAIETTASATPGTMDSSNYIEVETGITDGSYIEITSGLTGGDEIAYAQLASDSSVNSGFMMNGFDVPGDRQGGGTKPGGIDQ